VRIEHFGQPHYSTVPLGILPKSTFAQTLPGILPPHEIGAKLGTEGEDAT